MHFGAREYDPATGSFLRRDPSGFAGGVNLYAYVAGDPVNFVDRDGNFMAAVVVIGAAEGAIFGGLEEALDQAFDTNRLGGYDCAAIAAAAGKGALSGAAAGALGATIGKMASGRGCFVPGTTVTTERGPVPIERIEIGERVLSRDDAGELTYREVTRVFRRDDAEQLALTFTDAHGALEHIVTTPEHPFHVAGAGWVPAGELEIGAQVVTAEGGLARLSAALSLEKRGEVFNLEVAGTHSYFVGDAHLWVHNACSGGPKPGSAGGPGAGKRFRPPTQDAAETQAGGRCVFCGTPTTRERGPTQRNTDHAIPKSRGGNDTLDNAQNTCRTCNLHKGARTTEEFVNDE